MYLKDITKLMKCANKTARSLAAEHNWKPHGRGGYAVNEEEVLRVGALPREHYGNQPAPGSASRAKHGSVRILQVWGYTPMNWSDRK